MKRADGVGIVQYLGKKLTSFGDLANDYFKILVACVLDVCDWYDVEHTTKSAERISWSMSNGGCITTTKCF